MKHEIVELRDKAAEIAEHFAGWADSRSAGMMQQAARVWPAVMFFLAHRSSPSHGVNAFNQAISDSTCSGRKGVGRRLQTLRHGSGGWNACITSYKYKEMGITRR